MSKPADVSPPSGVSGGVSDLAAPSCAGESAGAAGRGHGTRSSGPRPAGRTRPPEAAPSAAHQLGAPHTPPALQESPLHTHTHTQTVFIS